MRHRTLAVMMVGIGLAAAGASAAAAQTAPQVKVIISPSTVAAGEAVDVYADVSLASDAVGGDASATFDPIAIGVNKFVSVMEATSYAPDRCPSQHACFRRMLVSVDVYTTPGPHTVSVTATDARGRTITGSGSVTITAPKDSDGDGLPDAWEQQYLLDPHSAAGRDGADGDPDGDGVSNLDEYRAHTNPVARFARVFAEGSYGDRQQLTTCFVVTRSPAGASALSGLRMLAIGDSGRTLDLGFSLYENTEICPLGGVTTFDQPPGFVADRIVAVIIESPEQIEVERVTQTLTAPESQTATLLNASLGVQNPSRTWYFARGAAGRGIDLFFLAFNPGTQPVQATFSFSGGPGDPPAQITRTLLPGIRTTVWVNQDLPAAATYDAAMTVTASDGIYVERAWRYQAPGRTVPFDSISRGASTTSAAWYFATGDLSASFDTSFVVMNPSDTPTVVDARFLRTDADPVQRSIDLPAHARQILRPRDLGIGGTNVALTLTAANGVGIVAERTTDGVSPSGPWRQSNLGATSLGTKWTFASSTPGHMIPSDVEHDILIANPSPMPGRARLEYLFDSDGDSNSISVDLPAQRVVLVRAPAGKGWLNVTTDPTTASGAPNVIVERASYVTVAGASRARQVTIVGNVLP